MLLAGYQKQQAQVQFTSLGGKKGPTQYTYAGSYTQRPSMQGTQRPNPDLRQSGLALERPISYGKSGGEKNERTACTRPQEKNAMTLAKPSKANEFSLHQPASTVQQYSEEFFAIQVWSFLMFVLCCF